MKIIKIRKRSGKFRTVVAPGREEKTVLRSLVAGLAERAAKLDRAGCNHGFAAGRSPVTAAAAHVGYRYTLSMDLCDFFDHVTSAHLTGRVPAEIITAIMPVLTLAGEPTSRCWQGLPTSPAAANIAASSMDEAILRHAQKCTHRINTPGGIAIIHDDIVYTRYADDMTFSFSWPQTRAWLIKEIPQITSRCGWKINHLKTRFMPASSGRRNICGVLIDADGTLHPRRAARKKLRAAQKQGRTESARGLAEWCKLTPPTPTPTPATATATATGPTQGDVAAARTRDEMHSERESVVRALCRHWDLQRCSTPDGAQADIADGDYVVTRDPAYILGMSTYTTGWTSCMSQPAGGYRRSVRFWCSLSGTSIAAMLSERTMTCAGITRRVMRARCMLHRLRDGSTAYDRLYGDAESITLLRTWLEARGCVSITTVRRGTKICGNVPRAIPAPWADNCKVKPMTVGERKVWVAEKK